MLSSFGNRRVAPRGVKAIIPFVFLLVAGLALVLSWQVAPADGLSGNREQASLQRAGVDL
jgi:hypothetical protein